MSDLTLPEIARPDADSARMVQRSIARLAGRELELTEGFYGHLFAMLPEVRALFPDDMAEQRVRLLKALLASVRSLDDPAGMEARLQALGEIHYYRGLADDQYQYVGHALIRTVRDVVPGDWSTWLSSAWISVYSWMIQHMVLGAKRARAQAEAGSPEASFEAAQRRYLEVQVRTGAISLAAIAQSAAGHPHVPQPSREEPQPGQAYRSQAYPGPGYAASTYPGHGAAGQEPASPYAGQSQGARPYAGRSYGAGAYAAPDHAPQEYAPQEYAGQEYGAQEYAGQEYAGHGYGGQQPGYDGGQYPYPNAWVRYPQLAEVGGEPVTGGPALVPPAQAGPSLLSPPVGRSAAQAADQAAPWDTAAPAEQPQYLLAGTPAAGTSMSWFAAPAATDQVTTVFPRRRRGTGLV